ncbi:BCCT family transporter [Leptobacterium flavescens]|uniref:BCCT family transporter n=1 Tax=Leptobacterium flavescens TaxID=472055 RepID=A0A6P0UPG1_9FLAO|nr:BCCT family transporter [Leptobacterium flavescens]NER15231.1 BCCT family transporter [Leptobacterium flavescens]
MLNNFKKNTLLYSSIGVLFLFSLFVFFYTRGFYEFIESSSVWVREWFGGFYLWLGLFCVLFLIVVAFSPLGRRRLGKEDEKPEHSRWAWISMLYSAGMGAGILLRAVQEPVYMQQNPPLKTGVSPDIMALEYTFYQWGFTAWAFYGLFAMIIGYYLFVHNKKVLVSVSIEDTIRFTPALWGIDVLAIITTVFGLIGAVGLGTTQINGGLNHLLEGEFGVTTTVLLTLLISLIAFVSVWKGVNKGIKVISKLNISVTLILLAYIFIQSDILQIFRSFFTALYQYIIDFVPMSIAYGDYDPGEAFLTDWTYYYWAFWLAWAPFTGIFIARISRGRTLREMLLGVMIIPSLGTFFWFSVFGESAFQLLEQWGAYNNEFGNVFNSIFIFFQSYPLQALVNGTTIVLLISFLVTSVDSAVFVLSMFTDKGKQLPSKRHRLIWSVFIAVFAVAIVILGNAKPEISVLTALQKLLIITSLPFSLFMVVMTIIFLKDFLRPRVNV